MEVEEKAVAPQPAIETQEKVQIERKNLFTLVQEWPLPRKIATAAVILCSIFLFSLLIIQARTANQQLLYANLSLTDASSVVSALKGQKIEYSLKNGGRDIWVSADQVYQTRLDLAAKGIPTGGGVGFEIFDKQSFALTDYVQKVNHTRALQGELARTITSLSPVISARVHLALPEKHLFKNEQKQATASVILSLGPGQTLNRDQVQGIIHLVAASVTGLEPDNVKIIDSNGIELDNPEKEDAETLLSTNMFVFQQEVEHKLELRAQDLLDKTMGKDNAMVRVTATLDFNKVEKTQEHYDSDDPVIRSEQVSQENNGSQTTGGIPGVQSNLQGNSFGQSGAGPSSSKNSRTTNYEISKTISKTVSPVGTITKLSVSVLVADKVTPGKKDNSQTTTPRSAEELKAIKNMVSTAIGMVSERGDTINVLSMPFVDHEKTSTQQGEQVTANSLYQYIPLIKYGLIALGILFIYLLLIRPVIKTMKGEVKEHYKTVEQLEREQQQLVETEPEEPVLPVDDAITLLRREVQKNHVPSAFIVKNWIQEG